MMQSKIAVVVTNGVEDVELTSPCQALVDAGYAPELVGDQTGLVIYGKMGTAFRIDIGIDEVFVNDYQALFIPGGYSPDHLRSDPRYVDFVNDFFAHELPVFAICHGSQLFITGGIARGKKMTAYQTVQDDLKYAGAQVVDQPVVQDGALITSRNPDDLPQFCAAIVRYLRDEVHE